MLGQKARMRASRGETKRPAPSFAAAGGRGALGPSAPERAFARRGCWHTLPLAETRGTGVPEAVRWMTPRTAARWRSPTRPTRPARRDDVVVTQSPAGTAPRDDRGRPAATRPAREARDRDADGETQVAERRGSSQFHSVEGACARTTRGRVWLTTTSRKGGRALSRGGGVPKRCARGGTGADFLAS